MHTDIPVDQNTWNSFKVLAIKKNRTVNRLLAEMIETEIDYQKPVFEDMGSGGKPAICKFHGADELNGKQAKKGKNNGAT